MRRSQSPRSGQTVDMDRQKADMGDNFIAKYTKVGAPYFRIRSI